MDRSFKSMNLSSVGIDRQLTPSRENSLNPQMSGAFGTLGIAGSAKIMPRGQIRKELNEIKESLDEASGGEVDPGGFDFRLKPLLLREEPPQA